MEKNTLSCSFGMSGMDTRGKNVMISLQVYFLLMKEHPQKDADLLPLNQIFIAASMWFPVT